MPLLRKKMFQKQPIPEFLRDDEEVFYCEITNEIFRDYEAFSERMFLCNSMVWTCSMTGKSNLTYQEALESEENAVKSLKDFPNELKIPILFLASKTKRTAFGEMADDVFLYAKDRYFIGENLEACFTANKWKDCHILKVNAPTEEQQKSSSPQNGNGTEKHFLPRPSLYKYEIEHFDAEDRDISEMMLVDYTQLRRKKTHFSRDKCKLLLKQYTEQDANGNFVIKPSVLEKYGINDDSKWNQIFDGPLPNFEASKKSVKVTNGKKKEKQETLTQYLKRNGLVGGDNASAEKKPNSGNNLLEKMKKREEEYKRKKQLNEQEKLALKNQKKNEAIQASNKLKQWMHPKEDLDLEDQMKLPVPTPVKSRIPDEYFGDAVMFLEFVDNFSKLLSTRDFFPYGLTLDILERAFMENEVAGPLMDIIQMLLTAIFNMQDEESKHYSIRVEKIPKNCVGHEGLLLKATYLASQWSNKYQGLPLNRLPMYPLTVSEILRIHLLSSGVRINENGSRHRYGERGGYTNEDDPGLELRLRHPHILKALSVYNVVELSIRDKITILSCLMNQFLTYADVRDVIEEKIEQTRRTKHDLRLAHGAERKRQQEFTSSKKLMQKNMKSDEKALAEARDALQKENEWKQAENAKNIEKLTAAVNKERTVMGYDRAFRKYIRIWSVPAFFVSWGDEEAGVCKSECTKQYPELRHADDQKILEHITSEKKSPNKLNGTINDVDTSEELLLCSAEPSTCIVHSATANRQKWSFFHTEEQIQELVNALNERGHRESVLKKFIKSEQENIQELMSKTPIALLNPDIPVEEQRPTRHKKDRYEDANLGYPANLTPEEVLHNTLVDNVLEMEEKICAGGLGLIEVKDREAWRECLQNKNYDQLDRTIVRTGKHLKVQKRDKVKTDSRPTTPENVPKTEPEEYVDPGTILDVKSEDSDVSTTSEHTKNAIKCLAIALAQVGRGVETRYLKKPLGHSDIRNSKTLEDYDVFDRWEESLLASTSFSQVFLHYGTLDSCIMWSRSALLARCRTCRRQKDSENMLLCDNCNLGYHLYCLKPKLTAVPKGDWFCDKCKKEKEQEKNLLSPELATPRKRRRIFVDEEEEDVNEEHMSDNSDVAEEQSSVEETDDDEWWKMTVSKVKTNECVFKELKVELCKVCGSGGELATCEKCSTAYHKECYEPPLRRLPRGSWICNTCKHNTNRRSDSGDDTAQTRRSNRREESRDDLPLHNVALQELLADLMKHEDAWPFLRPVQKNEVPDYYDVIEKPIDLGTIKYKLNMGEYTEDSQLMDDIVLIFENCNTYNRSEDDVYKCGVRLLKYCSRRARELSLKVPPELEDEQHKEPKSKRRRTK